MKRGTPEYRTEGGAHPLLTLLVSFPIACLSFALLTDAIYVQTANVLWVDFSAWLLAIGLLGGVLAALAGLITIIRNRHSHSVRFVWPVALGGVLVLVIAFLNNLVHSRDGWTSVMPTGLALSVVTVLIMLIVLWFASDRRHRLREAGPAAGVRH